MEQMEENWLFKQKWTVIITISLQSSVNKATILGLMLVKSRLEKVKVGIACCGNPSQSYRASPAIWDHTVLPATRHR